MNSTTAHQYEARAPEWVQTEVSTKLSVQRRKKEANLLDVSWENEGACNM